MEQNTGKLSVYIVEDEIAVRRSLIGKIRWDELGIYLMGQAQNAEEAYAAFQTNQPDILLLDMRMPGMGGMAFLDILKTEFPQVKVVVLSGYSDFEYVRRAIVCGASDYLLKPVIKEDLEESLKKVIQELQSKRQQNKLEIEQHILLNQSIPLFRRNLLNTLLQGVYVDKQDVMDKIQMLDVRLDYPYYVLVIINVLDYEQVKLFYGKNTSLVFFSIENVMVESMGYSRQFNGFKSEFRENEYVCIHGFNDPDRIKEELEAQYRQVIANMESFIKLKIRVSISKVYSSILDTPTHYTQTAFVSQDHYEQHQSSIVFLDDYRMNEMEALLHIWSREQIEQFVMHVNGNDQRSMIELVNELFVRAEASLGYAIPEYRKLVSFIYQLLEEHVQRLQPVLPDGTAYALLPYSEWVLKFRTPEELKIGLITLLCELAELTNTRNMQTIQMIHQAKAYIDRYYYENLTLDLLAQRYHMNRTYFSELFKQECGCSFKKYLIHVRIEKAKELLANQEMKAANVAMLVGFKDPIYFSTVFKKHTGLTIKEFKDNQ